jgi:V/A-type H+-transporting ATPase subunit D
MPRLKRTKSELKVQRENLRRYQRFLPTLQLKKQQLQAEVRRVEHERDEMRAERDKHRRERQNWVALFADAPPLCDWLHVKRLDLGTQHIAGVDVPVIKAFELEERVPDRLEQAVWTDEGLQTLRTEIEFRLNLHVLDQQEELLNEELRTTSQRVNLFEKIKIPQCRDNIRVIRIALGDEQVAGVARSKIAKKKGEHTEDAA